MISVRRCPHFSPLRTWHPGLNFVLEVATAPANGNGAPSWVLSPAVARTEGRAAIFRPENQRCSPIACDGGSGRRRRGEAMRGLLSERPSSLSSYERRFVDAAHTAGRLALGYRDTRKAMAFYGILARDPIDIGPRPHALLRQARRRQQRPQGIQGADGVATPRVGGREGRTIAGDDRIASEIHATRAWVMVNACRLLRHAETTARRSAISDVHVRGPGAFQMGLAAGHSVRTQARAAARISPSRRYSLPRCR